LGPMPWSQWIRSALTLELVDGRDTLPVEHIPSVERQPETSNGSLAVLKKPLMHLLHFLV
jgi:hypothetical protein